MAAISIFFDTNIIEAQFTHDKINLMFHNKIVPNTLFYDITSYIKSIKIEERVNLYISSISWDEMSLHLKENHKTSKDKFSKYIEAFNKAYGDTLDLSYEFKHNSIEQYNEYLEVIKGEFLSANNCNIIDYPKNVECFEQLVYKCVHKQSPFQKAKGSRKEFSDAGFKDALILETIICHKRDTGNTCIFITNDGDFGNESGIHICSNLDIFKNTISQILGIQNNDTVRARLNDEYIKETIVAATGNAYDESVSSFDIVDIVPIAEEDDLFDITIKTTINETEYNIKCQYEMSSNNVEVLEYHIENE